LLVNLRRTTTLTYQGMILGCLGHDSSFPLSQEIAFTSRFWFLFFVFFWFTFYFFPPSVLGIELRALYFLGKHCTTLAIPLALALYSSCIDFVGSQLNRERFFSQISLQDCLISQFYGTMQILRFFFNL
jgi:hypothetical protein